MNRAKRILPLLLITGSLLSVSPGTAHAGPEENVLFGVSGGEVRIAETDADGNDISGEAVYPLEILPTDDGAAAGDAVLTGSFLASAPLPSSDVLADAAARLAPPAGRERCLRMTTRTWRDSLLGNRRWTVEGIKKWCFNNRVVTRATPQLQRVLFTDGTAYDRGELPGSRQEYFGQYYHGVDNSGHVSKVGRSIESCTIDRIGCYANETVRIDQFTQADGSFKVVASHRNRTGVGPAE